VEHTMPQVYIERPFAACTESLWTIKGQSAWRTTRTSTLAQQ